MAEHGWKLLPLYELDRASGQWSLRKEAASIAKRAGAAAHSAAAERREKLHRPSAAQQRGDAGPAAGRLGRLLKAVAPSCFGAGGAPDTRKPAAAATPDPTSLTAEDDAFLRKVKALGPLLAAAPATAGLWDEPEEGLTQAEVQARCLEEAVEVSSHADKWVGMLVDVLNWPKTPKPGTPLLTEFAPSNSDQPLPRTLEAIRWWMAPNEAAATLVGGKRA